MYYDFVSLSQVRFTDNMPSDYVPKSVTLQANGGPGGNWTEVKTFAIPEMLNGPITFGGFSATGNLWRLHVSETHSGLYSPQVCELQFFGQEGLYTFYYRFQNSLGSRGSRIPVSQMKDNGCYFKCLTVFKIITSCLSVNAIWCRNPSYYFCP